VRTKDQTKGIIEGLAAYVNEKWIYDPLRPNLKGSFYRTASLGKETNAVFQDFQEDNNLPLSNKIDDPLLSILKEKFEALDKAN